jgi:hypothetical protein
MNFSKVLAGMEVGIFPLCFSTTFYSKFGVLARFVEFCQIKANYAKGGMLQWEYKRPARKRVVRQLQAQVQPVEKGDQNVYQSFVLFANRDCSTCSHSLHAL